MSIVSNAISIFLNVLSLLILIRCILSWFPMRRSGPVIQLIYAMTDPIILPIRSLIDKSPLGGGGRSGMMIDFSPLVALMLISVIRQFL